ncbi:uncharacterized protein LOC113758939 [Coffea eugenioides]|uniref:uncharacterized protein LOC113758939 n=1 Tax=Coffea eugenioides TaxID=49369 RepID=UPI000F60A1F8|nr:uncharacterized protein LOC113758939 [Coffea eugenioides]
MNSITHFSPPHELKREEMVIRSYEKCKLCQQEVLPGVVYRCERPKYLVHGSCAELPWHLRHPFHPDHTLTQFDIAPDSKSCSVCGDHFGGCAYRCSECEFVLNLSCAALTPSRIRGPELKINHQHPVTAFDKPKDHKYSCFICGEPFGYYQAIYFCSEYKRSAIFAVNGQVRVFLFQCSSCDYCEDLDCAKLVPTIMDSDRPDHGYIEVQPTSHDHRLIQCNSIKNFKRNCSGCGLPFDDSIDVCLHCRALLHESCANMPEKVIHSFHPQPQHCLTLFDRSSSLLYASVFCSACGVPKNLIYMCQKCNFSLDIKCATAKHPLIRSKIHQDDLAYFNNTSDN